MTIAFMSEMRELSDSFKLSVRSAGEVFEAVNSVLSRMRTTGEVQYWDTDGAPKNLTKEALVNAAVLYIDSLPHPEKVHALNVGMARLRSILETDKLAAAQPKDFASAPPAPPPKRSRRSG